MGTTSRSPEKMAEDARACRLVGDDEGFASHLRELESHGLSEVERELLLDGWTLDRVLSFSNGQHRVGRTLARMPSHGFGGSR
jgi:hypothetical protein